MSEEEKEEVPTAVQPEEIPDEEPAPEVVPEIEEVISVEETEEVAEKLEEKEEEKIEEAKPEEVYEEPVVERKEPHAVETPSIFKMLSSIHKSALEAIQKRRRAKLEKIIAFALEQKQKGKVVTNDEVQLLLGVSDSTAARYLGKLVKEGRLSRSGEKKGITYEIGG